MPSPHYTNPAGYSYDYAINGIAFYSAASNEYPYIRQTADYKRDQIDSSTEPGEQSLSGWWYRAQSSFHKGPGIKYYDVIRGNESDHMYEDGYSVNPFTRGQVSLVKSVAMATPLNEPERYIVVNHGSGVLYAKRDSGTLYYMTASSTTTVTWDVSGENDNTIADICSDGTSFWVLSKYGTYRNTIGGTAVVVFKGTEAGTSDRGRIGIAKDRVVLTFDLKAWAIPMYGTLWDATNQEFKDAYIEYNGSEPSTSTKKTWTIAPLEAVVATLVADGLLTTPGGEFWRGEIANNPDGSAWWGIADAPAAIYMAASTADRGFIWKSEIDPYSEIPEYGYCTIVAELPRGERICNIMTYAGTFLIIGTTKGVRVAVIGGDGSLVVGPLSVESDARVEGLFAYGNYVYAGGASVNGYHGLYRLDLTSMPDNLKFPVVKDMSTTVSTSATLTVTDICQLGTSNRLVFALSSTVANVGVSGSGIFIESATDYAASGVFTTGKIRMDTFEDKIFKNVTVSTGPGTGNISVRYRTESTDWTSLGTVAGGTAKSVLAITDSSPRLWIQFEFTLTRTSATATPVFLGYQVKSYPAPVRQREIQVSLLCHYRENTVGQRVIERETWARIKALEALERTGQIVKFLDIYANDEVDVIIDRVQFRSEFNGESIIDKRNPSGVIQVLMRVVD